MKFAASLLLAFPVLVQSATVTFYAVHTDNEPPAPTGSVTYSAIGVGADGATTYGNEVVFSEYLGAPIRRPTTFTRDGVTFTETAPRRTITTTPVTIHATMVADASHYVYSASEDPDKKLGNNVVSCRFDGKGGGSCVDKYWIADSPTTVTSYTGSVVPYYTLISNANEGNGTQDNTNGTQDSGGGGSQGNAATKAQLCIGLVTTTLGVAFGFFLGL